MAWRSACAQANDWDRASTARLGQAAKNEKKRIEYLERELARKDRALAETAAILVLRKKAPAIWGDEAQSGARQIKPSGGQFEAPNTRMPGPALGMFFYLSLIVEIFSRKIVGWEVHEHEGAELAAVLIQQAVLAEGCTLRPLVLHTDPGFRRGAAPRKALR